MNKKCLSCEIKFKSTLNSQKYCSARCRNREADIRWRNKHRAYYRKYMANYMITRYHNDPEFRERMIAMNMKCQRKKAMALKKVKSNGRNRNSHE